MGQFDKDGNGVIDQYELKDFLALHVKEAHKVHELQCPMDCCSLNSCFLLGFTGWHAARRSSLE